LEVKDRIDIIGFDIQGKTTKNTVGILKNATILDIRNSAKGDSVYVLGLNDGEIVALNDALANKWYLQAVLLHRDAAKTTGKLIR
jgi:hypothetical protein